jgi:hypothetical protein
LESGEFWIVSFHIVDLSNLHEVWLVVVMVMTVHSGDLIDGHIADKSADCE